MNIKHLLLFLIIIFLFSCHESNAMQRGRGGRGGGRGGSSIKEKLKKTIVFDGVIYGSATPYMYQNIQARCQKYPVQINLKLNDDQTISATDAESIEFIIENIKLDTTVINTDKDELFFSLYIADNSQKSYDYSLTEFNVRISLPSVVEKLRFNDVYDLSDGERMRSPNTEKNIASHNRQTKEFNKQQYELNLKLLHQKISHQTTQNTSSPTVDTTINTIFQTFCIPYYVLIIGMTGIAAILFIIYKKVMYKQKVISNPDTMTIQADGKNASQSNDDKNILNDEKDDTNINERQKLSIALSK